MLSSLLDCGFFCAWFVSTLIIFLALLIFTSIHGLFLALRGNNVKLYFKDGLKRSIIGAGCWAAFIGFIGILSISGGSLIYY